MMDLFPKRPLLTAALVAAQLNESAPRPACSSRGRCAPTRRWGLCEGGFPGAAAQLSDTIVGPAGFSGTLIYNGGILNPRPAGVRRAGGQPPLHSIYPPPALIRFVTTSS